MTKWMYNVGDGDGTVWIRLSMRLADDPNYWEKGWSTLPPPMLECSQEELVKIILEGKLYNSDRIRKRTGPFEIAICGEKILLLGTKRISVFRPMVQAS